MFTQQEILKAVRGSRVTGRQSRVVKGISIDSRTVKPGELFIPIKGPKFDGRDFIPAALKKGALVLETKAGLKALQELAAYHRNKFNIPIIGVTGSAGKTTTKDMIASILSREMPTLKNEENFNNEIGVPLTLLKLTKKHRAAVIEMAMQGLGEIELLARIVRPKVAVVTNIGEAHLEFLKSTKNIAKAKAEIFKFQTGKDFAVINADDEHFEHLMTNVQCPMSNVCTFGIIENAKITPNDLKGINLPIPGEHNIYNALAAIAVAKILKCKKSSIRKGLESFRPSSNRMDVINRRDGVKIINDTYNANPQSMAAALKTMAELNGRKIAVLGDMLELGRQAKTAHDRIIKLCGQLKIDKVYTLGQFWPRPRVSQDKKSLIKNLKKIIRPRDIILIKGSRGMKMEEVVEALR
ncbi:MAG: UDP-N-acetylmuramoyl-tripeptide--D-alanyl-D-alanine ligase [Candidatus Margulisbacteria bacterium]|nr:UDP-N-acetylmuramoyl-tripeptide--D-alanyl-D-alanine ligase [Candidatus Margulisiibacteriota bacterium]